MALRTTLNKMIMFGYATTEGPNYMPLAWSIARDLIKELEIRMKSNPEYSWVRPDMKSQVTIDYDWAVPRIHTIVLSVQTVEGTNLESVRESGIIPVVEDILAEYKDYVDYDNYILHFNATGKFEIGGPYGDCGVTGRKIVVDQYGGYAPVGGGNLNGKDATKVDRSAAYMARYLAKNIVAADLLSDCTIQIGYCIGVSQPVSLNITTTDLVSANKMEQLEKALSELYDLSPAGIIKFLDLKTPRFVETSQYGHFGNDYATWEQIDEDFINKVKNKLDSYNS